MANRLFLEYVASFYGNTAEYIKLLSNTRIQSNLWYVGQLFWTGILWNWASDGWGIEQICTILRWLRLKCSFWFHAFISILSCVNTFFGFRILFALLCAVYSYFEYFFTFTRLAYLIFIIEHTLWATDELHWITFLNSNYCTKNGAFNNGDGQCGAR